MFMRALVVSILIYVVAFSFVMAIFPPTPLVPIWMRVAMPILALILVGLEYRHHIFSKGAIDG